jgi:hypothetical protein
MTDIKMSSRNNEVRVQNVVVASLTYNQPKNTVLTSGETYACGTIPAGALVKSVDILIDEAFNGSNLVTGVNIGVTGATTLYASGVEIDTVGVTAGAAGTGIYYTENTDILITPTLETGVTNAGSLKVLISVIMPGTRTGSYTA